MEREVPRYGARLMGAIARDLDERIRNHLKEQGRGGEPPPLSDATRHLYNRLGPPNGSGIINHLTMEFRKTPHGTVAIVGIPEGEPTMIAKVQDMGQLITVTDAMRGFLASQGIFLRADTHHIYIPPRRFWRKSVRATRRYAQSRLRGFMRSVLK